MPPPNNAPRLVIAKVSGPLCPKCRRAYVVDGNICNYCKRDKAMGPLVVETPHG